MILTQPKFEPEEFLYDPLDPASVNAPAILDPAAPLGAGKWSQLPKALLHDDRIHWFDRRKGATLVKLDSREQSTLNVPNLEVNYWVLSPDGNQVFVWGARKITSVIAKQLREDLTTKSRRSRRSSKSAASLTCKQKNGSRCQSNSWMALRGRFASLPTVNG